LLARWRNGGGRNTRGDPRSWRPIQCVHTTNHDENCGSFSPFLGFSIPLTPSVPDASAPNDDTDEDRSPRRRQHKPRGISPLSGDGRNDKRGFNEAGEVPALRPHTGYQPHTPTNHTPPIDHAYRLSTTHRPTTRRSAHRRHIAPIDHTTRRDRRQWDRRQWDRRRRTTTLVYQMPQQQGPTTKGTNQRRKAAPDDEGYNPMAEGSAQRPGVEPNDGRQSPTTRGGTQ